MLAVVGGAGCDPCAAVERDLRRTLRENAVWLGVDDAPAAAWTPHVVVRLGPGHMARAAEQLDSSAAIPELRVEGAAAGGWSGRALPTVAGIAVEQAPDGGALLRIGFRARDGASVRVRGAAAEAMTVESVVLAPLVLDVERNEVRVALDFALVDAVAIGSAALDRAPAELAVELEEQWRAELLDALRVDVGAVVLLGLDGPTSLALRIASAAGDPDGGLELRAVTRLRPPGAFEAAAPSAPGIALHPGLVEAWLRDRFADNTARRTLDDSGELDPAGAWLVTLDRATVADGLIELRFRRWCVVAPDCAAVASQARIALDVRAGVVVPDVVDAGDGGAWVQGLAADMPALWSGFALRLPGSDPEPLLVAGIDDAGGPLLLFGR